MAHGSFYWNELSTPDVEKTKAFYAETLGWTYEGLESPSGTYWVIEVDGKPAGGISAKQKGDNSPPTWFSYICVDNVDQSVAKLKECGGEVIAEPFDVPGVGRISIVLDNTGAASGWMTPVPTN